MRVLTAVEAGVSRRGWRWAEVQPNVYRLQTEAADVFLASRDGDGTAPHVLTVIDKSGVVLLEFITGTYDDDAPDGIVYMLYDAARASAISAEPTLEALIDALNDGPPNE
jgi:hypothetical protein